jgi:hypothetical protein
VTDRVACDSAVYLGYQAEVGGSSAKVFQPNPVPAVFEGLAARPLRGDGKRLAIDT